MHFFATFHDQNHEQYVLVYVRIHRSIRIDSFTPFDEEAFTPRIQSIVWHHRD